MTIENAVDLEDQDFEEWTPGKELRFLATVEIVLDENFVSDGDDPIEFLKDEVIKVKSGLYENLACGWITKIERLPDNTEETE